MTETVRTNDVTEVAPGVFQLRIPMPGNRLGYTLPYLVIGESGRILIDTGLQSPEGIDSLRDQLVGQLGIQPGSIETILLTHNHPDHTGLVAEAVKLTGARTAMHRVDWESNPFRGAGGQEDPGRARTDGMERMRGWFIRHGVPPEDLQEAGSHRPQASEDGSAESGHHGGHRGSGPTGESTSHLDEARNRESRWNPHALLKPDVMLEGGEEFAVGGVTLEAVWTPGHTAGHLCFYDRSRELLFTGDHILPVITSNVSTRMATEDDPLGDYLDSIAKVGQLDVRLVLPAHQHHFTDLQGRIRELHRHHDVRLGAVLAACAPGATMPTAYEVASVVPWDVGSWADMDQFLRRVALGETLSHLDYLRKRGRVERVRDDPYARWTIPTATQTRRAG